MSSQVVIVPVAPVSDELFAAAEESSVAEPLPNRALDFPALCDDSAAAESGLAAASRDLNHHPASAMFAVMERMIRMRSGFMVDQIGVQGFATTSRNFDDSSWLGVRREVR